jgi:hypothetical protein
MTRFSIRPWIGVGWMLAVGLFASKARADIAPDPDPLEQGLMIALLLIVIGGTLLLIVKRLRRE